MENHKPIGYDGALGVRTINCLKNKEVPEDENGMFGSACLPVGVGRRSQLMC